jgi:hypothetical protein
MNTTDTFLAKKRLAHELKILVIVQGIALCITGLGSFLFSSNVVPNYPDWDTIHLLCGCSALTGIIVSIITACWGSYKLMDVVCLPMGLRIYSGSVWILLLLVFLGLTLDAVLSILLTIGLLLFYCIIPQFFIARWLANVTKDATITA